jgi:hypothetical protein
LKLVKADLPAMLYKEDFPVGSKVRIASREFLGNFERSWKYRQPLESSRLHHASEVATVSAAGFYHEGNVLYQLRDMPGSTRHEACPYTDQSRKEFKEFLKEKANGHRRRHAADGRKHF